MPICVHCGTPNDALFTAYGPSNIVCSRCKACQDFVDPYIEQEAFIVALDLILVKPRAYRHLLFNRPDFRIPGVDGKESERREWKERGKDLQSSQSSTGAWIRVLRQFLALLLVDSYVRWYNENDVNILSLEQTQQDALQSTFKSYMYAFYRTAVSTSAMHAVVLLICYAFVSILKATSSPDRTQYDRAGEIDRFKLHSVSSALLLASLCPTFLLGLLLLWQSSPGSGEQESSSSLTWSEDGIEWAVRTLVTGLSSGVALGVVLPMQRTLKGGIATLLALVGGWTAQLWVSYLTEARS